MQEFLSVFKAHREEIEQFIIQSLKNVGDVSQFTEADFKRLLRNFPAIELVYVVDKEGVQTTPNYGRRKVLQEAKGRNRQYLKKRLDEKETGYYLSKPYVSSATGDTCLTFMIEGETHDVFVDFDVTALLVRLGLIELHENFNKVLKGFYFIVGAMLMLFATLALGYAVFEYVVHLFNDEAFSLEQIFKPIVALTLGLAIFDLAKTILEREVFFKSYAEDESEDSRLLSKFLIAIIVALSIEALMVVFKIAINDYTQMIYALYLIIGVTLIIAALAFYHRMSRKDY